MKGILEGILKKNSDAILGYLFPKICIIRFCHIEMRVDTKEDDHNDIVLKVKYPISV